MADFLHNGIAFAFCTRTWTFFHNSSIDTSTLMGMKRRNFQCNLHAILYFGDRRFSETQQMSPLRFGRGAILNLEFVATLHDTDMSPSDVVTHNKRILTWKSYNTYFSAKWNTKEMWSVSTNNCALMLWFLCLNTTWNHDSECEHRYNFKFKCLRH